MVFQGAPTPLRSPLLAPGSRFSVESFNRRPDRFPRHRLDRRTTPLFVHTHTGQRITTRQIQYLLERIYREAGIRAQVPDGALVHALRHPFAMDLLDHGASIVEVQATLGHESVATTRRYLTARPHQLREAVAGSSFFEIDWIAFHCDGCPCSRTIRTARWRTSTGYLPTRFLSDIAPSLKERSSHQSRGGSYRHMWQSRAPLSPSLARTLNQL